MKASAQLCIASKCIKFNRFILILIFQGVAITNLKCQQVPDTTYKFSIHQTAFQIGEGPLIYIDEAHHNFHTRNGGFFAFSKLLEQDGYVVKGLNKALTNVDLLKGCRILVIVNPLDSSNVENWFLPTPSAFSKDEIGMIKRWVENGGSLFLVVDHMPFAGASYELGKAFAFEFINGFAMTGEGFWPPSVFSFKNGMLLDSPVIRGLKSNEKIDSVTTFTGSAFKVPAGSLGVLRFLPGQKSLEPDTAWRFYKNTPSRNLEGYYQGALLNFGKGKVAVFGEAAMFTAQIANGMKAGFNSELAPQNAQFTLNLIHWLDGVKQYSGSMGHDGNSVSVPFILDHNRMLVEAEFEAKDGTWCNALLWVDTGNPDFFISEAFAGKLGMDIDTAETDQEFAAPNHIRIGGMPIKFTGVNSSVGKGIRWIFNTMHNDGNLPSTVLKNYHVVFDYPKKQLTMAEPGVLKPRGNRSPAVINRLNGILQMDAVIDGEKYSLALDNGASCSFVPDQLVEKWRNLHPGWPGSDGAAGCANMWGCWPMEEKWPMVRIPDFQWGNLNIENAVIAGLPPFFRGQTDIGTRYSQKTANPVIGFLGPNVFKNYRVEIDYPGNAIYFEKAMEADIHDMDLVGLTLKPLNDGRYQVIGVVMKDGKPTMEGVENGDILLQIGDLVTTGATMGTVVDALRGKPGEVRALKLEREGKLFLVETTVERIL